MARDQVQCEMLSMDEITNLYEFYNQRKQMCRSLFNTTESIENCRKQMFNQKDSTTNVLTESSVTTTTMISVSSTLDEMSTDDLLKNLENTELPIESSPEVGSVANSQMESNSTKNIINSTPSENMESTTTNLVPERNASTTKSDETSEKITVDVWSSESIGAVATTTENITNSIEETTSTTVADIQNASTNNMFELSTDTNNLEDGVTTLSSNDWSTTSSTSNPLQNSTTIGKGDNVAKISTEATTVISTGLPEQTLPTQGLDSGSQLSTDFNESKASTENPISSTKSEIQNSTLAVNSTDITSVTVEQTTAKIDESTTLENVSEPESVFNANKMENTSTSAVENTTPLVKQASKDENVTSSDDKATLVSQETAQTSDISTTVSSIGTNGTNDVNAKTTTQIFNISSSSNGSTSSSSSSVGFEGSTLPNLNYPQNEPSSSLSFNGTTEFNIVATTESISSTTILIGSTKSTSNESTSSELPVGSSMPITPEVSSNNLNENKLNMSNTEPKTSVFDGDSTVKNGDIEHTPAQNNTDTSRKDPIDSTTASTFESTSKTNESNIQNHTDSSQTTEKPIATTLVTSSNAEMNTTTERISSTESTVNRTQASVDPRNSTDVNVTLTNVDVSSTTIVQESTTNTILPKISEQNDLIVSETPPSLSLISSQPNENELNSYNSSGIMTSTSEENAVTSQMTTIIPTNKPNMEKSTTISPSTSTEEINLTTEEEESLEVLDESRALHSTTTKKSIELPASTESNKNITNNISTGNRIKNSTDDGISENSQETTSQKDNIVSTTSDEFISKANYSAVTDQIVTTILYATTAKSTKKPTDLVESSSEPSNRMSTEPSGKSTDINDATSENVTIPDASIPSTTEMDEVLGTSLNGSQTNQTNDDKPNDNKNSTDAVQQITEAPLITTSISSSDATKNDTDGSSENSTYSSTVAETTLRIAPMTTTQMYESATNESQKNAILESTTIADLSNAESTTQKNLTANSTVRNVVTERTTLPTENTTPNRSTTPNSLKEISTPAKEENSDSLGVVTSTQNSLLAKNATSGNLGITTQENADIENTTYMLSTENDDITENTLVTTSETAIASEDETTATSTTAEFPAISIEKSSELEALKAKLKAIDIENPYIDFKFENISNSGVPRFGLLVKKNTQLDMEFKEKESQR